MSRQFRLDFGAMLSRWGGRKHRPALDPNDVCCEMYNLGAEEITFRSFHVLREKHWFNGYPPKHWMEIKLKPGEWAFFPHQYYIGTVPSGSKEIKVLKNFGDAMFKGNKHPSAPEVRRTWVKGGTSV